MGSKVFYPVFKIENDEATHIVTHTSESMPYDLVDLLSWSHYCVENDSGISLEAWIADGRPMPNDGVSWIVKPLRVEW